MAEVYRVDVMMTLHNQRCINTWHLVSPDSPDMVALLPDFVTGVIDPQIADTASAVSFDQIEYRRVDIDGTSGALFIPSGWPDTGTDTGADLPSFAALLIKGIASGQPRPNKIRKFLPGVLETDSAGSGFNSTLTTKATNIVNAWKTYVDSVPDLRIVSASYVSDPGPPPVIEKSVNGRWNEITDFSFSNVIAVMGTRKVGRGV